MSQNKTTNDLKDQTAKIAGDVQLKAKETHLNVKKVAEDVRHNAVEAKLNGEKKLDDLQNDSQAEPESKLNKGLDELAEQNMISEPHSKEKLEHIKNEAGLKFEEAKLKAEQLKHDAVDKLSELKAKAVDQLENLKVKATNTFDQLKNSGKSDDKN